MPEEETTDKKKEQDIHDITMLLKLSHEYDESLAKTAKSDKEEE
jgi:hypothetical protein